MYLKNYCYSAALIEGALLFFIHVKIINISLHKAIDICSINRDFDYYKVPRLLQHASNSAAGVEAHE